MGINPQSNVSDMQLFFSWDTLRFQMKYIFTPWNKQPLLVGKLCKVKMEYVWLCEMLQFYDWCEKFHLGYLVQFSTKIQSSSTCRQYKRKYICCLLMQSKFEMRKHRRFGLIIFWGKKKKNLFLKNSPEGHILFLSSFKLIGNDFFPPSLKPFPPQYPSP